MSESLRRQLSSPGSLFAFEATARLSSFRAAATELNVTQPSISYQIKNLEKHLSVNLFERKARNVFLTPEGEILYEGVRLGFDTIQNSINQIHKMSQTNLVTICTSSSVASPLILPKLPKFREKHPEVDISLKIVTRDINPSAEGADFAIRLGNGKWDNLQCWPMFTEVYFPLCSPKIVESPASEITLEQLKSMNLLHLKERFRERVNWSDFFSQAGDPFNAIETHLTFSDQQTLLDAAISGQGVGLGWLGMTNHFLATESLVKLTSIEFQSDKGFYLVAPKEIALTEPAQLFRDWFLDECHQIQQSWEDAQQTD